MYVGNVISGSAEKEHCLFIIYTGRPVGSKFGQMVSKSYTKKQLQMKFGVFHLPKSTRNAWTWVE